MVKEQGVEVVRYGLSLTPDEFKNNQLVNSLITQKGRILFACSYLGRKVVYDGSYPSRLELARMCNVEYNEDEAPPIHREENCCCGVDCDCRMPQSDKIDTSNFMIVKMRCGDNCISWGFFRYAKN